MIAQSPITPAARTATEDVVRAMSPAAFESRACELSFDLDPAWFARQLKLARSARTARGVRLRRKDRERLLVGFVDGVLVLAFPHFEVSTVAAGTGEGWFSLEPQRLAKVLATFGGSVRVTVGAGELRVGSCRLSHDALSLRRGRTDPALAELVARIDELAAEACFRRLAADAQRKEGLAGELRWHRAEGAVNTAPLVEYIRDGSLIVYRRPEAPADAEPLRGIVDMKRVLGSTVVLCCHDFRGAEITVDPRWVTHVGC